MSYMGCKFYVIWWGCFVFLSNRIKIKEGCHVL